MRVVIEISALEARFFHHLIHEGMAPDKEWIDPEWIKNNPDKRTALEHLNVIYEADTGIHHLTNFGVKMRHAFGGWQPPTDFRFDERAFTLPETVASM